MKKIYFAILLSGTFLAVGGLSFWAGKQISERGKNRLIEGIVLNNLGNTLSSLRYIDQNQLIEAQRLLQAETNGQLSWLVALDDVNDDPEYLKSRCKALNTLKQYREKHQLFKTSEWDDLWKYPGAREEEAKREKFLTSLSCLQN